MLNRDDYVAKMQQRSDELKAEIDTLEAQAQEAKADAKAKYQEQIRQLRTQYQEGETKLEALKATGVDSWEKLKGGVDIPGRH